MEPHTLDSSPQKLLHWVSAEGQLIHSYSSLYVTVSASPFPPQLLPLPLPLPPPFNGNSLPEANELSRIQANWSLWLTKDATAYLSGELWQLTLANAKEKIRCLRQIFTDRSNCSILPSPNELKNVLSVCAFDSLQRNEVTYSFPNKWNVYLTRSEKRLSPDCSEFASRCYRYVCDQLTTIEAVFDVFEFIKCSWPGNNKILDRLADRLIDKKILAFTLFSSTVHEQMQVVRG